MINIVVWSKRLVDIENKSYDLNNQEDMTTFLLALLDKVHYSGESTCLETATFNIDKAKAEYTEIQRWKSVPTP